MIRLYVDHDSAERALVSELRRRGMDVLTSIEAGNARASDEEQLAFATGAGRVIYTANARDFAAIHFAWLAHGRRHRGIVVRDDQLMPLGQQILRLADISATAGPDDLADLLLYLDQWLLG